MQRTEKKTKCKSARSKLKQKKTHITGYPREHYNIDKTEKAQYKNEASAVRAARFMTARTGELIEAYRCTHCGCWHIGHRMALPKEEKVLALWKIVDSDTAILNRYRIDLNHVAAEVLAISTKIDQMERKLREDYQELKLIQNQQQQNNNGTN